MGGISETGTVREISVRGGGHRSSETLQIFNSKKNIYKNREKFV